MVQRVGVLRWFVGGVRIQEAGRDEAAEVAWPVGATGTGGWVGLVLSLKKKKLGLVLVGSRRGQRPEDPNPTR